MNDTTSKAPVYAVACKPVAFVNSSHRRHWTFVDADALRKQRCAANEQFRLRFISTLDECAPTPNERHALIDALLDPDDERDQCAIICSSAVAFADAFQPPLWPSTRAIAFELFRRFYSRRSVMEYSPKNIMLTAFFVATKIDDFYVPIARFCSNMTSGTADENERFIRSLETVLLSAIDYHLIVHLPFRPLDGHLIMAKTSTSVDHDEYEQLRVDAMNFLAKVRVLVRAHEHMRRVQSTLSDALMLYAPTQIALAALVYAARARRRHESPVADTDTQDTDDEHCLSGYIASMIDAMTDARVNERSRNFVRAHEQWLALTRAAGVGVSARRTRVAVDGFSDTDDEL